jgi:vacuolar-type H+-ATPase subunit H
MGDVDLKRLLDAERAAERSVQEARDRSRRILRKAEEDAADSREARLAQFENSREKRLKEVKEAAVEESARIRKDGVILSEDLRKKAKGRMDDAVEKVLETIKESF